MRALTMLFATTTLLSGLAATAGAAELPAPQAACDQMVGMEGTYALSDGRHARIFVMDGGLHIELGRRQQQLEPAGPDRWVTRDRSFSVLFRPEQPADRIVLNYRDAADTPPIRLAANEVRGRGGVN